ncbi:bacterial type II secretion system F domain protein [Pseudarthrobacter siccitolerans]|uniref:Bacterial type II secretion system F domain protein n=1 Tax=Pseudarthrobacter siccitolerans TaxID=861266 RepID=A0A024H0E5_9MICC|nr:type II secretion system F family protein [Pseudarthrobacter siccitolerans]CCQ45342.1 bacterial type II secretion system F domain protein [Pseudarthrobacter siccitolerans]
MTPLAWVFISLIVFPLAYLVWGLATTDRKAAIAVQTNLTQGFTQEGGLAIQRPPALLDLSRRLTPTGYEAKLDRWLSLAGRPASLPLDRLIVGKPLLALAGAVLGLLMFANSPSAQVIALGLFLTVLLYFVPDLLVYNKGIKRQQEIELELPNTLDQLLISVEAGLGFEAAMARAGGYGGGALAQELMRTLQDIQVGRPRQEAYQALADRSSVQDLRSFVRAVVQADKYGIGIAKVLRTQAKQARVKRRQRAEEKAMKLPVKVLFPLLLCIFPVLFIVLLGPAAIKIVEAFT